MDLALKSQCIEHRLRLVLHMEKAGACSMLPNPVEEDVRVFKVTTSTTQKEFQMEEEDSLAKTVLTAHKPITWFSTREDWMLMEESSGPLLCHLCRSSLLLLRLISCFNNNVVRRLVRSHWQE